jgi:phosphatidylglycerophosphatase A
MFIHKMLSTGLGIGYIGKGAGTVAALATCIIWYITWSGFLLHPVSSAIVVTLLVCIIGVWSSDRVEALWGKDSSRVVIDEVAGMCIALLFVPVSLSNVCIAFLLFRFFDIVKPLYIRRLENLKGGWGVMADDALAGIYANLVMQVYLILT